MKQIISLQLDSDLYDLIKADAINEGISASAVIRRLLIQRYRNEELTHEYKERQVITTTDSNKR